MAKQLVFDEIARKKALKGVQILTQAVQVTLGPKGRNVLIDKKFGSPTVTHDGVEPMECMWGHHPTFGPPLLSPGAVIDTTKLYYTEY